MNSSIHIGMLVDRHYVYTISQQYLCKYTSGKVGATARGMVRIRRGEETDLMAAVAIAGPVTIGIDHSHSAFQVDYTAHHNS